MFSITNIGNYPKLPPPGASTSSIQSGGEFQLAALTRSTVQSPTQAISSTASSALGSQTLSTLLQTQDLDQTQAHGGGGGGGHRGGMKMAPGLEVEEAGESEEAQLLCQRRKMAKMIKPQDISGATEVDENGVVIKTGVEQAGENQPGENGLDSGIPGS